MSLIVFILGAFAGSLGSGVVWHLMLADRKQIADRRRARAIAWLRDHPDGPREPYVQAVLTAAADALARGDHLR